MTLILLALLWGISAFAGVICACRETDALVNRMSRRPRCPRKRGAFRFVREGSPGAAFLFAFSVLGMAVMLQGPDGGRHDGWTDTDSAVFVVLAVIATVSGLWMVADRLTEPPPASPPP